jgi:predicted Zn-dependent protease
MIDPHPALPAQGFHPQFPGQTLTGTVRATPTGLHFDSDHSSLEFPWTGLVLEVTGYNDEHLMFQHPSFPGCAVSTRDPRILSAAPLQNHPALKSVPRRRRTARRLWVAVALGLALVLAMLALAVGLVIMQKNRLVRYLAQQVPIEWEQQLGSSLFEQIRSTGKFIDTSEYQEKLARVSERLIKAVPTAGYTFQFHVQLDTNLNAFALPGGYVVVNTGLLDAAKRPEEIAGVLAHELAHVTLRHGFRKIIDAAGLSLTVHLLLGDATGVTAVIANGSQLLLRQKYSRDFEREADDQGWDYLLAAQIDPRGMIDFFEQLRAVESESGQDRMNSLSWLNTHPATKERIEHLEAKWKTNQVRAVAF